MRTLCLLIFLSIPGFAAPTSTPSASHSVKCESKSGVALDFPVYRDEGQTLSGDILVTETGEHAQSITITTKQVVGYWYDEDQFAVKALDDQMKDRILELHTKKGKGNLFLRMGKTFLSNVKVSCEFPTTAKP